MFPATTYCLNLSCPQPENLKNAQVCQGCGRSLQIATYQGIALLGQGGTGRTILAVRHRPSASPSSRPVVIKQLTNPADPAALERFRQEAAQLQRLGQHPQIPTLIDQVETRDSAYGPLLVQDYIPGSSLAETVEKFGPCSAAQTDRLLRALLPVLEYIHSFGTIHRDIKPQNVILPPEDAPPVLVDFGAAIAQRRAETVIGSAEYIAPEQAMGQAVAASDLYSLGVTCLYAFTGQSPFDLYSAAADRWVWRDFLTAPVNDRLGQVLDQLVARSLFQRYATAAEALADLARSGSLLARLPLAKPAAPTPLPQTSELPWRRRYALTTLGVIPTLAVGKHLLATGSGAGTISLLRLADGTPVKTFRPQGLLQPRHHSDQISALEFASGPGGDQRLYSASWDGTIKVWDIPAKTLLMTLPRQSWIPSAIALAPSRLVTAGGEGRIALWDRETLALRATLTQHQDRVSRLAVAGDRLASASWDGTLRLWQLPQGQLLDTIKAHTGRVTALALHPGGTHLVSGGEDGTVKVWRVGSPGGHASDVIYTSADAITDVALSPDARLLAVGTEGNSLSVWEGATGRCVSRLEHGWGVLGVSFVSTTTLVSSSRDETVSVWERG